LFLTCQLCFNGYVEISGRLVIDQAKKNGKRRAPQFDLCGGIVCLDLVNTLDDRYSGEPKELLQGYEDVVRFAEDSGLLDGAEADRLTRLSLHSAKEAKKVRERAIQLRETIYGVFWALVQKKPVPAAELAKLNRWVQEAGRHRSVVGLGRDGPFQWTFDLAGSDLSAPLWPMAQSAAELLASERAQYVRACASKTCEWLFLDESKNHGRRWCDMTKCGNRAKVRAFYDRQKHEEKPFATDLRGFTRIELFTTEGTEHTEESAETLRKKRRPQFWR
jgi:predicted RNA-binding Zn ribbon-like protein